ncbi:MAG: hypothetical protein A2Z34_04785, partial [Planctomycetes bacterium RBG_16_59_8]
MAVDETFDAILQAGRFAFKMREPLAAYTTFKLGGPARYLVEPRTTEELSTLVKACRRFHLPLFLLGGGSNLLVRDEGVDGVVIRLASLDRFADDGNGHVGVGAGYSLTRLVKESLDRGYVGLESLAGIPGTVAGAAIMNAGGKYGEIGQYIVSATVVDTDGDIHPLAGGEMLFEYRRSNLRKFILTDLQLKLNRGDTERARELYRKIMEEKRTTQPLGEHNAGCVFKNPPGLKTGKLIDE